MAAFFGLYRIVLRYVGIDTLLRVAATAALGGVIMTLLSFLTGLATVAGQRPVPLGVALIQAVFVFLALSAVRVAVRAGLYLRVSSRHEGKRTLIIGAGSAGSLLLNELRNHPNLHLDVVGFLDDNPAIRGRLIAGIPIVGTLADLESVADTRHIEQVYVALPSASAGAVRAILNRVTDLGLDTHIMPKLVIEKGRVDINDLRKVDVTDLLGRELTPIDSEGIRETIASQSVVVTGAAGSIGAELCRQLVAFDPAAIHLFEIDESRLYELWFELDAILPGRVHMHVVDIRDRRKLNAVMCAAAPTLVLHAAAYKQVPLMESEPLEALHSNVVGTANVLTAAQAAAAARFVLISTDKAVAPLNVMGKTKQLAERLILACSAGDLSFGATKQSEVSTEPALGLDRGSIPADPQSKKETASAMTCLAVRFGNVLGSRGSVVPIFEEKLARGEDLTVTDPEVTRYFMTIPEAARLVLQAQAIGQTGDIFLLEMGDPVRIVDLARKMIALSGVPADIRYTGLRPGEKLHEALVADSETLEPTERPNILRVRDLHEAPLTPEIWQQITASLSKGAIDLPALMHW
ncbi:MAG: polysaccharide biosynthesis protein [Actinomycetes bacterium]|nr:polysaccharide biosynthesis protein [Actinomycetes bacterium]